MQLKRQIASGARPGAGPAVGADPSDDWKVVRAGVPRGAAAAARMFGVAPGRSLA